VESHSTEGLRVAESESLSKDGSHAIVRSHTFPE